LLAGCLLLTIADVFNKPLRHGRNLLSITINTELTHTHTHTRTHQQTFLASSIIFNICSPIIIVKAEWKKLSLCQGHYNTGTNNQEKQKTFKILSLTVSLLHILLKSISLCLLRHKRHATQVNTESSPEVNI
jgi:hypothetical protein